MAERYRWTNTGASLIKTQARDGALVRQINEPPRKATADRHIHIYLPEPGARAPLTSVQLSGGG
jgi:hypothetical protein